MVGLALDAARVSRLLPVLAAYFAAGILAGWVYFRSLWWTANRLGTDGRITSAVAVIGVRFAMLGGLLCAASLQGAAPLLAMALGVLLARFAVLRRFRVAAP